MQSFKELILGAFFHSWQRTVMVLGGLILAIALPITIFLTQQQQDLRQRAAGVQVQCGGSIKITCPSADYGCSYSTRSGYHCIALTGGGGAPIYQTPTPTPTQPATNPCPNPSFPIFDPNTGKCGNEATPTQPAVGGTRGTLSTPTINNYTNVKCNEITVSWASAEPKSSIVTQRFAYRLNDGTTNWNTTTVTSSSTSRTVSGLNPNTDYFFQVGVSGSNGNFIWSNIGSKKTLASCGTVSTPTPVAPNCLTSVVCTGICDAPTGTCGTSNGLKNGCKYTAHPAGVTCTPVTAPDQVCGKNNCVSGSCINNACVTPSSTPTSIPTATKTPVPTPTKTPTTIPSRIPTSPKTPTPTATKTPVPTATGNPIATATSQPGLTCDPVPDGVIDLLDFQLWKDEYTGVVNTKKTACFANDKSVVDLIDFQVWLDIYRGDLEPF